MNHIKKFIDLYEYINENINVSGWLCNIRIHKSIIFIILRNSAQFLQCVAKGSEELYNQLCEIPKESYIKVEGKLNKRSEKLLNPSIEFGDIEISIDNVEVISYSSITPFEIENADKCSDELKCEYRFLSLRNTKEKQNILLRHEIVKDIRMFFYNENFTEINTPLITCSTPEGAQDYLVLSQKFPGKMYALPQSPQLFKQLLMFSDFRNYFQIAPCFRDEAARKNRLPTEFYQLDIEINHIDDKKNVMDISNKIILFLLEKYRKSEKIVKKNFTYSEAMNIYGIDKVDLRVLEEFNLKVSKDEISFKNVRGIKDKLNSLSVKINKESEEEISILRYDKNIDDVYILLSESCNDLDYISYCWITEYPFFEQDKDGNLEAGHNPFCKKLFKENSSEVLSMQYDLVINGEEIGGGSIRETSKDEVLKTFFDLGYKEDEIKNELKGFLNAFDFGTPNHGGIAFGIERLCCLLKGEGKIRDFVAFPFLQSGKDLLFRNPKDFNNKEAGKYGLKNLK